ncbi:hypothetical protein Tco_0245366 [Tanacetum coccineum]
MYPPTTSEPSTGDSSSESFAGPSHKRYRSPPATVTSYIHATRALVSSRVDLLPLAESFTPDAAESVMIEDIKTRQRELESRSLIAGGERASLLEQNMTITRSGMTPEAIEELVNRQVEEALAAYEATRPANTPRG